MEVTYKKPPLGVMPRSIHDIIRQQELAGAIKRYSDANMIVPSEWIEELKELNEKRRESLKNGR